MDKMKWKDVADVNEGCVKLQTYGCDRLGDGNLTWCWRFRSEEIGYREERLRGAELVVGAARGI